MSVVDNGITVLSLFDGKYEVTSDGDVFSNVGRRKKLIGKITDEGYHMVVLTVDGVKRYPNVHRIVAENFIPNPLKLPEVNHKDGNKTNQYSQKELGTMFNLGKTQIGYILQNKRWCI